MIPRPPRDSHPLPGRNYGRRSAPSESSITLPPPSLIIKQVYELRPTPDCIQEHQLSSFYESERASVRTRVRARVAAADGTFLREEPTPHLEMLECLQVTTPSGFSGEASNSGAQDTINADWMEAERNV